MNLNQNNEINYQSRNRQSGRTVIETTLHNAHGKIPYGMTNDYMFRAVLQSNNKVLRGLICSLLHLTEKEVFSVEITNPIILGESVESKPANKKSIGNLNFSRKFYVGILRTLNRPPITAGLKQEYGRRNHCGSEARYSFTRP